MEAGEVAEILGMMTPEATVSLVPLNRHGPMAADGASYLRELARSFPDLLVRVRRLFVTGDNIAVAEITIDGKQARDFGIIVCAGGRYELPHLFVFHVTGDGLIDDIVAYWDNAAWKKQLGCLEVD